MGYKCEQFVDKVDHNLICSICYEVLQDPHQCKEGHSFCKVCITEWLQTRQTCPMDNSVLRVNNLVRNLIVHNMVQNLEVWCHPGKKEKVYSSVWCFEFGICDWKGKLQTLAKHRETCPFQQVRCPNENCNETMQRRELGNHDMKCEYKKIECDKCRKGLIRHELLDHMIDECPERRIPCPNKCITPGQGQIQKIKRADLDNHLKTICPKTKLDCQFKDQGCSVQVERQHVDKHVQDNRDAHMMLLAKQCSSLTTENNRLRDELSHLKEEFHNQLSSSSSYDWTVSDYTDLSKNHPNGSSIERPTFWLRGHKWRILLFPNGENADATGFLSLFLRRDKDDFCSNESAVPYGLTVLSQKPDTDHVSRQSKHVFTKEENSKGWFKFMKASDALSPSYCGNGKLTIQCAIHPDKAK